MASVLQRKREMVNSLVAFHLERYAESGAEFILGEATMIGARTVEVTLRDGGTRRLIADKLFLNLGTRPALPPVTGLADARPMTNIELLEIDRLPQHLIVLGGGYVGLELAQAFRRFGSEVTIIEHGERLAAREDEDVSAEVLAIFEREGIEVVLSTEAERVEGHSGEHIRIEAHGPDGSRLVEGSDLFVAAGRTPNTAGIGLEKGGVALTDRGYIHVNERLETTASDTWAIGECAGSPQFTHVSLDDFRVIRDNLSGGHRTTTDRLVPYCMFIDPPLARVGLTEREARELGLPVRVAKMPTSAILYADDGR
jgi:pyruvate/2-oxoglutarate dehydrogenase complex dihydrolipoamide dehydrogenase (E3) component